MSLSSDTARNMRYLTIAEKLRQAILDGTLPAGARLPGQRELAEQHRTALMTIRQALALLEAEGLVRFEHGVGTFVTDSGLDPDALRLASFGEMNPSAVQTVLRRAEATVQAPAAAQLLGLSPETPLGLLERLRLLEDRPIVYQYSFLPPPLTALVAGFRPERSLYRQIQIQFGERAATSRETLQPIALSASQAALLAQPAGATAFRSYRLTFNLQGRPLVYDEALLTGSDWVLVGDRSGRRGDWTLQPERDPKAALAALVRRSK